MSKNFIKLTIDVEYERSVMINVNEIVDIFEDEEYTQVNLKNTNYYRVKETVDEIYTEMYGNEMYDNEMGYGTYTPLDINGHTLTTQTYPDYDTNLFTTTSLGNHNNSGDTFISLTNS